MKIKKVHLTTFADHGSFLDEMSDAIVTDHKNNLDALRSKTVQESIFINQEKLNEKKTTATRNDDVIGKMIKEINGDIGYLFAPFQQSMMDNVFKMTSGVTLKHLPEDRRLEILKKNNMTPPETQIFRGITGRRGGKTDAATASCCEIALHSIAVPILYISLQDITCEQAMLATTNWLARLGYIEHRHYKKNKETIRIVSTGSTIKFRSGTRQDVRFFFFILCIFFFITPTKKHERERERYNKKKQMIIDYTIYHSHSPPTHKKKKLPKINSLKIKTTFFLHTHYSFPPLFCYSI